MSQSMDRTEAGVRGIGRRSLLTQALLVGAGGCAGMGRMGTFRAPPSTPRYDISVRLEPPQRRMYVSGVARFPGAGQERQELSLVLAPSAREVTFSCRAGRAAVPIAV